MGPQAPPPTCAAAGDHVTLGGAAPTGRHRPGNLLLNQVPVGQGAPRGALRPPHGVPVGPGGRERERGRER